MKISLLTESTRVHVAMYEPRISIIQEVVARHCGLTIAQTKTHSHKQNIVKARRMIYYFARTMVPNCNLYVLGIVTGNGRPFSHSNISCSYKKFMFELKKRDRLGELVYPEVMAEVNKLRDVIIARFEDARAEPTVKRCAYCGNIIH